jgi:multicomponent Na+:H+ antiporter subunit D
MWATLLPLTVAVPVVGAALLAAIGRWLPRVATDTVTLAVVAAEGCYLAALTWHASGGEVDSWVGGWLPGVGPGVGAGQSVGIVLTGDQIGAGMALLVCVVTAAALVYSWRYFEEFTGADAHFHALVLLFLAGMCGFALTGDLFDAFVFFELMGTVAYALTGYRVEERRAVQGAVNFGIVNSLGAYCSLLGIGVIYARTGELGFRAIGQALAGQERGAAEPGTLVPAAFVLVCVGVLVKAAVAPFHFWLPDAHAVAPTPASMIFSGAMVELGIYGVARIYWTMFAPTLPAGGPRRALIVLGAASALIGAVMCWRQRHLKRMLAFSTIAHTGLFLVGVGLLTPDGLAGSAVYVMGHLGVKAALFACAGILLNRFGTVDERELHGRGRSMPTVGVLFVLGALALAGLPPFGPGLGKGMLDAAAIGAGHGWIPALAVLTSALTGGALLRAALRIFHAAGPAPEPERNGHAVFGGPARGARDENADSEHPDTPSRVARVPVPMLAAAIGLMAASLWVGVQPGLPEWVRRAADQFTGSAASPPGASDVGWNAEAVLLGLLGVVLAVGFAAAAVWGARVRPILPFAARTGTGRPGALLAALDRSHSGHVGDYASWLVGGIALVTLLMWSPL